MVYTSKIYGVVVTSLRFITVYGTLATEFHLSGKLLSGNQILAKNLMWQVHWRLVFPLRSSRVSWRLSDLQNMHPVVSRDLVKLL